MVKKYNPSLSTATRFFVPHAQANSENAHEVIFELVGNAKDISIAAFQCFDGGTHLLIKHEVMANLIAQIQTKLEMIEQLLPMLEIKEGGINE